MTNPRDCRETIDATCDDLRHAPCVALLEVIDHSINLMLLTIATQYPWIGAEPYEPDNIRNERRLVQDLCFFKQAMQSYVANLREQIRAQACGTYDDDVDF